MDSRQIICVAYFDIAKCFNCIDHAILSQKIKGYGIDGNELAWFTSYLSNRLQTTTINGKKSSPHLINLGVPQGSVLGPLLFLLYLNDLPNITSSSINLYADDTCIYICGSDPCDIKIQLQNEANKISNWFNNNRLSLNTEKSSIMYIGTPQRLKSYSDLPSISVDGRELSVCNSVKYLGIHLDDNLSWKHHIDELCAKLSPKLGTLSRLSHILPSHLLNIIYNTTIQPHIDYGLPLWGHTYPTYIAKIQHYQNRAARLVAKKYSFDIPSYAIVKSLKWLNVSQRTRYLTCVFMHKIYYGQCPNYLLHMAITRSDFTTRQTRASADLVVPLPRTETLKRSLTYQGPLLWNGLPLSIRNNDDIQSFKRSAKCYIGNSDA